MVKNGLHNYISKGIIKREIVLNVNRTLGSLAFGLPVLELITVMLLFSVKECWLQ